MRKLWVLAVLLAFCACCKKKALSAADPCPFSGTIRDLDGLDGCGYLIELPGGELLNPLSYPEGFEFKDKKKIRFGYEVVPDVASICMAEKATIEITCIQALDDDPTGAIDCATITNPFKVPWMDKAIDRHNAVQVIKQQVGGQWLYLFKAIPVSFLYDCEGKLLCETRGEDSDECHRMYLNRMVKGKVIWQSEGVWD